eukprot:gene820-866_t
MFSFFGGEVAAKRPGEVTLQRFQELYQKLFAYRTEIDESNKEVVVNIIQQMTSALVWGEKNNDSSLFDFFCEKNLLAFFVRILGLPRVPKSVKVQIMQTLSMLLQNIQQETSLYYLLSNNYVNQLISTPFDWQDEEILAYYITFLKSLALGLNPETIKFFFNEKADHFPLYVEATRFFHHRDGMVRAAVRTLTLQIYKVGDASMRRFVLSNKSSQNYLINNACYLRELWMHLNKLTEEAASVAKMQEVIEELEDLLDYFSDVFRSGDQKLSELLANRLLTYALIPILCGSLIKSAAPRMPITPSMGNIHFGENVGDEIFTKDGNMNSSNVDASGISSNINSDQNLKNLRNGKLQQLNQHIILNNEFCLLPQVALYCTHQIFCMVDEKLIIEPLLSVLFLPSIIQEVIDLGSRGAPESPLSYSSTEKFSGYASNVLERQASTGSQENMAAIRKVPDKIEMPFLLEEIEFVSEETRNPFRDRILQNLKSENDVLVLLSSGVCISVLKHSERFPTILELTGILPPAQVQKSFFEHLMPIFNISQDKVFGEENIQKYPLEMLIDFVIALRRHQVLRLITFQCLIRCILDVYEDKRVFQHTKWTAVIVSCVSQACKQVSRHCVFQLHGSLGNLILDLFFEAWELHKRPLVDVETTCKNPKSLIARSADDQGAWAMLGQHKTEWNVSKALHCFLLLRRLRNELTRQAPQNLLTESTEVFPLDVEGEHEHEGILQEGQVFELGDRDRIACSVVTAEGRTTRYLVLDDFLLLLVAPDSSNPGFAVVKTASPLRLLESHVDRSDPRTLLLVITSQTPPGDVVTRRSEATTVIGIFELSLYFDDAKRSHIAHLHIEKRRHIIRKGLMEKLESFIESA